jgi:hypothetical protein
MCKILALVTRLSCLLFVVQMSVTVSDYVLVAESGDCGFVVQQYLILYVVSLVELVVRLYLCYTCLISGL